MSDDSRANARRQRRIARAQRREEIELLAHFMARPAGRRWLYNLLASCHVYSTSFATNALSMAFAEGERNVGIRIGAALEDASPDMFVQMLKEARDVRLSATDPNDAADEPDSDEPESGY